MNNKRADSKKILNGLLQRDVAIIQPVRHWAMFAVGKQNTVPKKLPPKNWAKSSWASAFIASVLFVALIGREFSHQYTKKELARVQQAQQEFRSKVAKEEDNRKFFNNLKRIQQQTQQLQQQRLQQRQELEQKQQAEEHKRIVKRVKNKANESLRRAKSLNSQQSLVFQHERRLLKVAKRNEERKNTKPMQKLPTDIFRNILSNLTHKGARAVSTALGVRAECPNKNALCGTSVMDWAPGFVGGVVQVLDRLFGPDTVTPTLDASKSTIHINIPPSPLVSKRAFLVYIQFRKAYPQWFAPIRIGSDTFKVSRSWMTTCLKYKDPTFAMSIMIPDYAAQVYNQWQGADTKRGEFQQPNIPNQYAEDAERCQSTVQQWGRKFIEQTVAIMRKDHPNLSIGVTTLENVNVFDITIPQNIIFQTRYVWRIRLMKAFPDWYDKKDEQTSSFMKTLFSGNHLYIIPGEGDWSNIIEQTS